VTRATCALPDHGRSQSPERRKEERRRAAGRCVQCGAPSATARCRRCLPLRSASLKCAECGGRGLPPGHRRFCGPRCARAAASRLQIEYQRRAGAYILSHRRRARAYQRLHRALGLCVYCPARAQTMASDVCERHGRMRRRNRRRRPADHSREAGAVSPSALAAGRGRTQSGTGRP
jgi:hypothetical protein